MDSIFTTDFAHAWLAACAAVPREEPGSGEWIAAFDVAYGEADPDVRDLAWRLQDHADFSGLTRRLCAALV